MESKKMLRHRANAINSDRKAIDPLLRHSQIIEDIDDETKVFGYYIRKQTTGIKTYFISRDKIKSYWAPVFLSFWILLYYGIAIPAFHQLPNSLSYQDEILHKDRFIAERAEVHLHKITEIGPRVVGSVENEVMTIAYLKEQFRKLKDEAKSFYKIEYDLQVASGSYIHWKMINSYQGVQNFIIKIGPKNTNSTSYLLVNSHFDSVPRGPGAGDDGVMVSVMLEVLRVLSQSPHHLNNPVIFLFNGAEENPLQGSHAFVTRHKWARHARALINLDSAGSGGREILFQSGPNHPWLMKLYKASVPHPFASTVAEEMFERHFIPSDTDFRIFRDYGKIPGLDMAHQYNGYVYHTRYDRPKIITRNTLQNTGDNVLALVRAIANSTELEDTEKFAAGHVVFYDVMGLFLVFYDESMGILLNIAVSLAAVAACICSTKVIASQVDLTVSELIKHITLTSGAQLLAVIVASVLCLLMALVLDGINVSMSWFTFSWLILGLYFCPALFGMFIIPAMYFRFTRDVRLPIACRVKMLLNCHCILLVLITLTLTICHIRSAFVPMLSVLFYTISLIINLCTGFYKTSVVWMIPHTLVGIPPFLFFAYLSHGFFSTFIPMTGRFGDGVNPDLIIAAFTIVTSILIAGFTIPVFNLFKNPTAIAGVFFFINLLCIIFAVTPFAFPYTPETNVHRAAILNVRRTFRNEQNDIRRTETGYFMLPQDRRARSIIQKFGYTELAQSVKTDCDTEMLCGLPLYNHRWHKARNSGIWLPGPDPHFNQMPVLKMSTKNQLSKTKVRFNMTLTGPDHMGIFLRPINGGNISNWSFHETPLRMNWPSPYFIYFSYGIVTNPLEFYLDVENNLGNWSRSAFEIGIAAHWIHDDDFQTEDFKQFLASLPKYVDAIAWPASYDTWYF
ncbi:endoplasmic reticulum metallopeptidase 1 isoform 3-T3 [Glossina fuscipes fuscipes]